MPKPNHRLSCKPQRRVGQPQLPRFLHTHKNLSIEAHCCIPPLCKHGPHGWDEGCKHVLATKRPLPLGTVADMQVVF